MIIKGQLEEPRNADQHGQNADAIKPLRADSVFEGARVFYMSLLVVGEARWNDRRLRWFGRRRLREPLSWHSRSRRRRKRLLPSYI